MLRANAQLSAIRPREAGAPGFLPGLARTDNGKSEMRGFFAALRMTEFLDNQASAEVGVVFVDPVLAGWGEDVEVDGVLEGDGGVGDAAGDDEDFAGVDGVDVSVAEVELDGALEDEGDLLVVVGVGRDDAAFGEDDAGEHGLSAGDELALQERVELFAFDVGPAIEGWDCCHDCRPFC